MLTERVMRAVAKLLPPELRGAYARANNERAGERPPSAWSRLLYASGSLGGNAIGRSRDLWLIFYYAPPDDADISRRAATLRGRRISAGAHHRGAGRSG